MSVAMSQLCETIDHTILYYIYTVGTESIQTPLHFSLFVILQLNTFRAHCIYIYSAQRK